MPTRPLSAIPVALLGALLASPLASQAPTPGRPSDPGRPPVTPELIASEVARAQAYVVIMDTLGPTPRTNDEHLTATQRNHPQYLFDLRRAGILAVHGPVLDGGRLRGIGILTGVDLEKARQLAATDPDVEAGSLKAHVFRWMGLPGDRLPQVGRTGHQR